MIYIAKVRQDEEGLWQYVDEMNCATEKQCRARRFRDRKIARDIALEYEREYKIVHLVPRVGQDRAEAYLLLAKEDRKKRIAAHVAKAAREEIKRRTAASAMQRSIVKWKRRVSAETHWEAVYRGAVSEVGTLRMSLAASEKECATMRRVVERARIVAADCSIGSESSYEEMETAIDELDGIHPPLPDERDEEIAYLRRMLATAEQLATSEQPEAGETK